MTRTSYTIAFLAATVLSDPGHDKYADLVVYGGTSGGVVAAAAVQAARMGKRVILIEPSPFIGGLTSGGLGMTDSGNKAVIGGISREFYRRIKKHYDDPVAWTFQAKADYSFYRAGDDSLFRFEPHVADVVFDSMVIEAGSVQAETGERLDLKHGVQMKGTRIVSITMESGRTITGDMFIDATYEGDLMALAGVSYFVGREANSQYGETLDGVETAHSKGHQFLRPVDPFRIPGDRKSGLLPGIEASLPEPDGSADRRIQAYCYRLCLTDVPENRIPISKPQGYDPLRYELLLRYLTPKWNDIFGNHQMMPNHKTDTNNNGAIGSDDIGMNYDYPEGDYATRERIAKEHVAYQQGLIWFLVNDPRVPSEVRERVGKWGLAKDEFIDSGNWPQQLYIREARRMVSDYVHTELDCRRTRTTPEPVGMGSYNMDSHNCQRYVDAHGHVRNEGDVQVNPGGPYQISYRSIRPKPGECSNLLVPVCLSSSHIAYGSIRMEPVFMVLGQSAATAACLAIDDKIDVQNVPYAKLRERLLADKQVLEWKPAKKIAVAKLRA